jgi:hypothetical protein
MAEIPMADLMPNISGVLLGARASGAVESRALVCSIGWLGLSVGGLWAPPGDPSSVLVPVAVLTPESVYGCRY